MARPAHPQCADSPIHAWVVIGDDWYGPFAGATAGLFAELAQLAGVTDGVRVSSVLPSQGVHRSYEQLVHRLEGLRGAAS